MASTGDVGAVLEPVVAPVVEQTAPACNGESGLTAATTTEEDSREPLLQERRDDDDDDDDTAPGADHHEAEAAVAPAAEVSASEEPDGGQQKPPVEKPEESTRERLKRHRQEMAGRVWVPEMWGQEKLLKDWVDCAVFDGPMVPAGLLKARRALIAECCTARRRPDHHRTSPASSAGSSPLRVHNGCS